MDRLASVVANLDFEWAGSIVNPAFRDFCADWMDCQTEPGNVRRTRSCNFRLFIYRPGDFNGDWYFLPGTGYGTLLALDDASTLIINDF